MASDRPFEALLTLLELVLQAPSRGPDYADAVTSMKDPRMGELLAAQQAFADDPRGKALEMVAAIDRLRPHAGRKEYVLETQAAGCFLALGQADEARTRLTEALGHSPFLTGAWKDLGEIYLRGWAIRKAWACWEAARRIAPEHPMLADVSRHEQRLEQAHPVYFPRLD